MNLIKKLLSRSEIRYCLAGCGTFIVDNLVFNLHIFFGEFGLPFLGITAFKEILFNILGMIAGLIFGFIVNRNWSFKATGNVSKQFFRCVLLFVFNLIVSSLFVSLLGEVIESDFILAIARLSVSILIGVWNYFAYKFFVYK